MYQQSSLTSSAATAVYDPLHNGKVNFPIETMVFGNVGGRPDEYGDRHVVHRGPRSDDVEAAQEML
jgi:hypothetical protein